MIGEVTRAQVLPSGPTATLLYDDWYPALRTSEIRSQQMAKAMLLGIPLVLGRTSAGKYFAIRDLCPHRGIPLSCGWFDGERVTCKYHGWAFEPVSGQCRQIPSLTSADSLDPSRIYAAAFPCEERDGHVWVHVPQPGRGRLRADGCMCEPASAPANSTCRRHQLHFRALAQVAAIRQTSARTMCMGTPGPPARSSTCSRRSTNPPASAGTRSSRWREHPIRSPA